MKRKKNTPKQKKIEIRKPTHQFDSKKILTNGMEFAYLPKQLQKYILSFLATNQHLSMLSLVCRNW